ncbi:MAG: DMT family transporter [Negativicutes bacterium]|nr:DMT family transporter [Negativicutes bacterium]
MRNYGFVEIVLLLTVFIWGINTPVVKIGLVYMPPILYNALRLLLATVIAWSALLYSGTYRPLQDGDGRRILTISLLGFVFFQVLFTAGLPQTTAGNASLVLALTPVFVAVTSRIFKGESIAGAVVAGIGVSLLGMAVVIFGSGKAVSLTGGHLAGALLILLGQVGNGYYVVYSKDLLERYSTYQITTYVMTLSALAFGVLAIPELSVWQWTEVPGVAWLSIAVSGTFGLCIGNLLWVWVLGKMNGTKASMFQNLSPIVSIAAGVLFLGESFGLLQLVGAGIVFAGLYLTRRERAAGKTIIQGNKAVHSS